MCPTIILRQRVKGSPAFPRGLRGPGERQRGHRGGDGRHRGTVPPCLGAAQLGEELEFDISARR